jgi:hypothetical protein
LALPQTAEANRFEGNTMAINSDGWGEVVISPNPKKTTAILHLDKQMNVKEIEQHSEETKEEKMARIKEERGRKLGIIK